jgi:peptidoglycan/xylan/chitin deacetylase (PgdA/CDA1 family)
MLYEHPYRHVVERASSTVSRRQFLFAGAALAVGTSHSPSLLDELTSGLDDHHEGSPPPRGESLPSGAVEPQRGRAANGESEARHLFLTFDDGPIHCTGQILDLLAETRHKITFFVIGRNLINPKLRDFAIRALREGHEIGNHSFSHPDFSRISSKRAEREIVSTHGLIEEIVLEAGAVRERQNRFFRFPYGVSGSWSNYRTCQTVLTSLNYQVAWWDLDTNDWRMELPWFPRPLRKVVAALNKAKPYDVVLLHDRSKTARCLPQLMAVLETQRLVSLPLSLYGPDSGLPLQMDPTPDRCEQMHRPDVCDAPDFLDSFLERVGPRPESSDRLIDPEPKLTNRRVLW